MTKESKIVSRKRNRQLQDRLLISTWLFMPLVFLVFMVGLAVAKGRKEPIGLIQHFVVTTPGTPIEARKQGSNEPGTVIPRLKREHIPQSKRAIYNSNPPTSGAHFDSQARWGIYNQAPVDELLVHNLEHGGIVVSYHPQQVQGKELEQLRKQVKELSANNPRIILTPRANLDKAIALTAWGYLQKLDKYTPTAVKTFYDAHIARGPECQKGLCPF